MSDTNVMNLIASDDRAPEPLPSGEYVFTIRSGRLIQPEDGTEYYRVSLQAEDIIELSDPDAETPDLAKAKRVDEKFWMSDKARYIYKEWLEKTVGLDVDDSYANLSEQMLGGTVQAVVEYKVSGRGTAYNVVKRWRPANEVEDAVVAA